MHSSRRAITLCGSALVAGGALLLAPEEASAADSYDGFSGGINLSFSVGAHPAFGVSLDLRYTHYIKGGVDPTYGGYDYWIPLGMFAQFGYLRGGAGRFSFGGHGGALAKTTIIGADGELGITYRTDYPEGKLPGGVGLHVGLVPLTTLYIFDHGPSIRGAIGLTSDVPSELILGWDIRGPGACLTFLPCRPFGVVEGRPLRVEDGAPPELAPLVLGPPRRTAKRERNARLDKATRSHIFAHWARQASAESASVPAFLALAGDLALAGAPDSLVRAALRSAEDESRHTALCASLAGDYSSSDISALTPDVKHRPALDRASLLKRLALESFWDGCVGEGAAAAKAARLAKQTRRDDAALAHSLIAAEEASHAALAEQVLSFCISAGGKLVRDAVAESIEERCSSEENAISADFPEDRGDIDRDLARACGVPLADDERLGREQAWETSLRLAGRMMASPLLA